MTGKELERRIEGALSRCAPDDLEGVLSRCETRKGNVISMTTRRKNSVVRNLIAACLVLAIVGAAGMGVIYQQNFAVASIVSIDVNPSIELTVNKNEKVISCQALNDDAKTVLSDMGNGADLKNTKLDVAVNALVGALVRNGYLDSISSALLISVEDKDQARAEKLEKELTASVGAVLRNKAAEAAVMSQTVTKDTSLEKLAKDNGISTGKAALINGIVAKNDSLKFTELASLSVEEISDMLKTGAAQMPIGREEALRIAVKYADVKVEDIKSKEVDAELDDRVPHYDIEIRTSAGEFEYEVDAYTGAVIKGVKDINASAKTVEKAEKRTEKAVPKAERSAQETKVNDISKSEALDIATEDFISRNAELKGEKIIYSVVKPDDDRDEIRHYDVQFVIGRYEVEYEIETETGRIIGRDIDIDDRFDDDDDDRYDDDDDDRDDRHDRYDDDDDD